VTESLDDAIRDILTKMWVAVQNSTLEQAAAYFHEGSGSVDYQEIARELRAMKGTKPHD
jgi:hypothetical protein